jgi:uncharacterized protein (DUF1800 family)
MRSTPARSRRARRNRFRFALIRSNFGPSNSVRSYFVRFAPLLLAVGFACAVPQLLAKKKPVTNESGPNEQKRALHALNRLTFGPRPGDVQQVMTLGVDRWIDLQLHPEKISDSALEARLAPFRTLRMSSHELVEEFPDNQMVKQVMDGKKSMPSDPAKRAVYQVQIARLEEKQEARQEEKQAEKQAEKNSQKTEVTSYASAGSPRSAEQDSAGMRSAESDPAEQRSPEQGSAKAGMTAPGMAEARSTEPGSTEPGMTEAGSANGGAKTAEELAAAAAASPDAMPATPADANLANPTSASNAAPGAGIAMPASIPATMESAPAEEKSTLVNDPEARRREERLYADLKVQSLADLPPEERYKKVMSMSVEEKVAFADSMRGGKGQEFLTGLDPKQKETLMAMNNPQAVVGEELVQAKLLRAIYSERQLEQVMTDFWLNHFNVFINKGADRVLLTNYEQDVIRPRALGKFEDLLVATAKSPAMLFYLDNWLSVGPNSMQALGIPAHPGPYYRFPRYPNANEKRRNGLNENYGRELLELHTLSVNGGYTQRDVTEVAKVFTGWTIDKPYEGGGFQFDIRKHEPGPKFVLGHRIKFKGEDEGREVLHMLATSPQTAHFISLKLAQRFVSDDPPPALVDRMAKTFLKKKGDIREVLTTLFHSPEFWDDTTYRAKVKTPLEFVASAARATGADVEDAMPLARQIANMGMPLYQAQPPTGYSMKAETWVSSSALLSRMNFALAFAAGKIRGAKVDAMQLAGGPPAPDPTMELSTLEAKLLTADVSKQTHDSIVAQIAQPANNVMLANNAPLAKSGIHAPPEQEPDQKEEDQKPDLTKGDQKPQRKPDAPRPPDASTIAGLLLGSPEFQRR